MKIFLKHKLIFLIFAALFGITLTAQAQTTAFNFQGRLNDGSSPANGRYDLQFLLYDSLVGGNQVGAIVTKNNQQLINGVFSTQLDFGAAAFTGGDRFLEIQLRPTGSPNIAPNAFVILGARQQLLSVPYAVKSLNATNSQNADNATTANSATTATTAQTAVNSQQLGGIASNRYLARDSNGDISLSGKVTFTGNINQVEFSSGLPKAIIHLDRNGVITSCYNGITGALLNTNCGFTASHLVSEVTVLMLVLVSVIGLSL